MFFHCFCVARSFVLRGIPSVSLFLNFLHLSWALAGCRETADVFWWNQTRRRCDNDLGRWIESIRKGSNWLSWSKLGWRLLLSRTTATISWFRNLAFFFFSVKRQFGSRLNAFARQSLVCSKRKPRYERERLLDFSEISPKKTICSQEPEGWVYYQSLGVSLFQLTD